MKSSDRFAVPLCQSCHAAMHHFGGESTWFAMNGVPAYEWAELNGDKRDDEEAETPEV